MTLEKEERICSNCKYYQYIKIMENGRFKMDFMCANPDSENAEMFVFNDSSCIEFEEKERN